MVVIRRTDKHDISRGQFFGITIYHMQRISRFDPEYLWKIMCMLAREPARGKQDSGQVIPRAFGHQSRPGFSFHDINMA